MNHRLFQEDIAAYVAGRLEGEPLRRLEAHLTACESCAELAESWKTIAAGLRESGEELFLPHPEPEVLMDFARGTRADEDGRIARHLECCAPCQLEVSIWRSEDAAGAVRPAPPRRFRFRPRTSVVAALAAAAGLVLGVGLSAVVQLAGVLGWTSGPTVPGASWTGAVELIVLERPLRSDAPLPVVELPSEQPYLAVAVAPVVPEGAGPAKRYGFTIREVEGGPVWSVAMSAGEIRDQIERSGVVTLLVAAGRLAPGDHVLVLSAEDDTVPLLEIPFRVRR